jgi:hypothetical protein
MNSEHKKNIPDRKGTYKSKKFCMKNNKTYVAKKKLKQRATNKKLDNILKQQKQCEHEG